MADFKIKDKRVPLTDQISYQINIASQVLLVMLKTIHHTPTG